MGGARYDGLADWFDREFATGPLAHVPRDAVLALLDANGGRLLDVGCGTGTLGAVLVEHGWSVTGVDVSADQLRLARERGLDVVQADAAAMPFGDASFDACVSTWTHTDVDAFDAMLREIARVLAVGAPFVYVGAHPCFVGPHSAFVAAEGVPQLHPGYRRTGRYSDGPGINPTGLRARVGATHLPLALFLQSFLAAGFRLERIEEPEPEDREYPYMLAMRWRR